MYFHFFFPPFILAHQWYILPFSPLYLAAFLRRLVTLPLQLAPARFTRPGLLLPFFLPSAKFSTSSNILIFLSMPSLPRLRVHCLHLAWLLLSLPFRQDMKYSVFRFFFQIL